MMSIIYPGRRGRRSCSERAFGQVRRSGVIRRGRQFRSSCITLPLTTLRDDLCSGLRVYLLRVGVDRHAHMMWSRGVIGPLRPMVWFLALDQRRCTDDAGVARDASCILQMCLPLCYACVRSPALSAMPLSFDNRLFGAIGNCSSSWPSVRRNYVRYPRPAVYRMQNQMYGAPPQDPPFIFASLRQNCTA